MRPIQGGTPGAFTYAAASRVGVGAGPTAAAGATTLTAPGIISTPGTYVLDRDITATGTAFRITAADVTLDLGGHTITYGTGSGRAHGVHADGVNGRLVVRGGAIVQGGGGGSACHGVRLIAVNDVRVSGLNVTVTGRDADGISIVSVPQAVRVDHCVVHCGTTVVSDRHWPGVAAIRIDDARGSAQIDHNRITASPQWGLRLQGDSSSGDVLVHHNQVLGTKALVANGYMLGIYKRGADVFENHLEGESRGIHVASSGSDGIDCRVHHNVLRVQDQTNAEYPDHHWVHGIKIEGAPGCKVHDNVITGVADDEHAEVRAIDVGLQNQANQNVQGVEIVRNRVSALARGARFRANALMWSQGTAGSTNDLVVRHNVFTATDRVIMREWGGGRGALMRDNVLRRDLGLGAGHEFYVEEFGNGGTPNPGNRLLDTVTDLDLLQVTEYHGAKPWDATREWTLALLVRDARGAAVPDAVVTVTDAKGERAFETRTDAEGRARGTVVQARLANGLRPDARGPFTVRVTKGGVGTWEEAVPIAGRTALIVDLTAATATIDSTAPTAPVTFFASPLSGSRVLLRWSAGSDASGIAAWLVYVDGEPAGITDAQRFTVPGLTPGRRYTFAVRALDCGGNRSEPVSAEATTRLEDRGPGR
ncbi:MAG: hypothetical protein QNJ90_09005 [Planctomycetota bacterium]|nr:hypothetical protein [Planctomycetota bacterium]